jgi:hypothetical protein
MRKSDSSRKHALLDLALPAIGAIALFGLTATANAAAVPVTFAQAIESSANTNPNAFAYNNNGVGSDAEFGTSAAGVLGAAIPIDFTYLAGSGVTTADLIGVQNATISMTSSTKTLVASAFGGTFADEALDGTGAVTDTIKITRTTPAAEGTGLKTNLLTVVFTGNLAGPVGGTTPSLTADSNLGDTVTYSSDFISFAQSTQQDFSMALSSWDPIVTPPTGLAIASDGYFNSATTAAAATFDFQNVVTAIPEPGSLQAYFLAGMCLLVGLDRRFRSSRRLSVKM